MHNDGNSRLSLLHPCFFIRRSLALEWLRLQLFRDLFVCASDCLVFLSERRRLTHARGESMLGTYLGNLSLNEFLLQRIPAKRVTLRLGNGQLCLLSLAPPPAARRLPR